MIIGLDFDNTLVNYDTLFYKLAIEKGLIPKDAKITLMAKTAVRDYLRKIGKEDEWTLMQGEVYGKRILEAAPYENVINFLKECESRKIVPVIISHKTRYPILSNARAIDDLQDLHDWAKKWIKYFKIDKYIPDNNIYFELTKEAKLDRIKLQKCDFFVDDLPEFLLKLDYLSKNKKILFDPNKLSDKLTYAENAETWSEISTKTIMAGLTIPLLKKSGFSTDFSITSMQGGKNNRVYQIITSNIYNGRPKKLLLKAYYRSQIDRRDRLGAEYAFLDFLVKINVNNIPKPYAKDSDQKLGLYQFIEGRKPLQNEISSKEVDSALNFIIEINKQGKNQFEASSIPNAAEACFSIKSHIDLVNMRLSRLETVSEEMQVSNAYFDTFIKKLRAEFNLVTQNIKQYCTIKNISLTNELDKSHQLISPSDFGMHNVLITNEGKLVFLDFEYAGWDDPAKLVCDFFCQPEIPVSLQYFDKFSKLIFANDNLGFERAKLLLPLYDIKWCCIMLNEFLLIGRERREYAKSGSVTKDMEQYQLQRAIEYYDNKKYG